MIQRAAPSQRPDSRRIRTNFFTQRYDPHQILLFHSSHVRFSGDTVLETDALPKLRRQPVPKRFVVVTANSYGRALQGLRIYHEGWRPKKLTKDGQIKFGKAILESLLKKFGKRFRWIITKATDDLEMDQGIANVRISIATLNSMHGGSFERLRDVKIEIVERKLFNLFPSHFSAEPTSAYVPGTLARILNKNAVKNFTSEDKERFSEILPEFLKSEAMSSLAIKAAEIDSLRGLAQEFRDELSNQHSESWWQEYIRNRILIIQQGYIRLIEKMNVAIGNTKYPDFALVSSDNYLDILEIKKPNTPILKADTSRGNYHWDVEIARAVIQVENYLEHITNFASDVRSYIKDKFGIEMKVVRPRGFILAGHSKDFASQKHKDDFRLLSHGLKNVTVITYDELLRRLENHIRVLEEFEPVRSTSLRQRETHSDADKKSEGQNKFVPTT